MRTRSRDTISEHTPTGQSQVITLEAINNRLFVPTGDWFMGVVNTSLPVYDYWLRPGVTGTAETIVDETGQRGHFNRCYHSKVEYMSPLQPVTAEGSLRVSGQLAEGSVFTVFNCGIPKTYLDQVALHHTPVMAEDDQLLVEAASQCHPAVVKPGFDLSLQLGEMIEGIKGIKNAIDTVLRIRRDVDRLNRWNSPAVRRLLGERTFDEMSPSMKDWASLATSAHLGYTLAISPLIKACKQLFAALRFHEGAISKYMSSEEVYHGTAKRDSTTSIPGYYVDPHRVDAFVKSEVEVHATVKVKYGPNRHLLIYSEERPSVVYPGKTIRIAHSNAFDTRYYSVVPTVSTMWALMPFSFIVDWFCGFGRVMAQWAEKPLSNLEYTIVETGWSVKRSSYTQLSMQMCQNTQLSDYGSVREAGIITGTRTSEDYRREPKGFDPTIFTPSPPKFGLPNLGQTATLFELIYQVTKTASELVRVAKPGSKSV